MVVKYDSSEANCSMVVDHQLSGEMIGVECDPILGDIRLVDQ
jgi:hypothetical protein